MTYLITIISAILLLSACNNNRSQRLSASRHCQEGRDDVTEAPSEKQLEALNKVDLPANERLEAISFSTTIELVDSNEEKVFVTILGATSGDNTSVSVDCTRNLSLNSKLDKPVIFNVPYKNGSGDFTEIEVTLEGRAGENKNLPFATVTSKIINPVEEASDDSEAEPKAFSSYFEGEKTQAYQFKKGKDKDKAFTYYIVSEDLGEGLIKATTLMNLVKVTPEEDKK